MAKVARCVRINLLLLEQMITYNYDFKHQHHFGVRLQLKGHLRESSLQSHHKIRNKSAPVWSPSSKPAAGSSLNRTTVHLCRQAL